MSLYTFCNSLNTKPFQVKEIIFSTEEIYKYQECLSCGSLSLQTPVTDYSINLPLELLQFFTLK